MVLVNCCINSNIDIKINNNSIARVYVSTFLCVLIDHKLNWKEHVSMMKSNVSTYVAIVYSARHA